MPILFLDRDGTLMHDVGYPRDPADVRLLPGAVESIRLLSELRYTPAVVSNQSGIGRGLIAQSEADAVHNQFVALFVAGSFIELPCYYCPHAPEDDCSCRKPKPGLLLEAARSFGEVVDEECVMIGDKPSDVDAGRAAGCGLNLLFRGDWDDMVRQIGHHERRS